MNGPLDTSEERWAEILGSDGRYVSTLGRVWTPRGTGRVLKGHRIFRANGRPGSVTVLLHFAGKPITKSVHRLVLEAFVGPCPFGMEGCHGDGDPFNNKLDNLRWDTHQANMHDGIRHGTFVFAKARRGALTKENGEPWRGAIREVNTLRAEVSELKEEVERLRRILLPFDAPRWGGETIGRALS